MSLARERSVHTFTVGDFDCVALNDGTLHYEAGRFFANAEPDELERALAEHDIAPAKHDIALADIQSPYACLLVQADQVRVLIDTGGRGLDPGVGRLRDSLRETGVQPGDIDIVVLTHGHPDHVGGNVDDSGTPAFPKARYVISRVEWEFWTSQTVLERVPEVFRVAAVRNLPPLEERLMLVEGETEIVPGVQIIPTPGHTPGHVALAVASQGEELLYISAAFLHPVHLEHPAWHPTFDIDPATALASKRMLCDRAAANHSLVAAYHFDPFPGLGHVAISSRGWEWEPIA